MTHQPEDSVRIGFVDPHRTRSANSINETSPAHLVDGRRRSWRHGERLTTHLCAMHARTLTCRYVPTDRKILGSCSLHPEATAQAPHRCHPTSCLLPAPR